MFRKAEKKDLEAIYEIYSDILTLEEQGKATTGWKRGIYPTPSVADSSLEKDELFVNGYIAKKSSHSRGSTIDLTLLDMKTGKEVDMGSPFDFFGEISHPDYKGITEEQFENRMTLRNAMIRNGFMPYECEWWHFTLQNEPYPDTYFEFPVSSEYLRR